MEAHLPTVLTIAGSDSSGGAGIQADLKTFAALGVYGASVITVITAQSTVAVRRVLELPPDMVAAQLEAVLEDIGVAAVKTGLLGNAALIEVVSERLAAYRIASLVVDPVMVATSGDRLLRQDAIAVLRERLVPMAMVLTPNVPEAEALVGRALCSDGDYRDAARALVAMGARNVVVKGGHADGQEAVDLLYDGRDFFEFRAPRISSKHSHGTGCTFSAAIAGYLALGDTVPEAVRAAKEYVTGAIEHGLPLGHGRGPLDHNWRRQ